MVPWSLARSARFTEASPFAQNVGGGGMSPSASWRARLASIISAPLACAVPHVGRCDLSHPSSALSSLRAVQISAPASHRRSHRPAAPTPNRIVISWDHIVDVIRITVRVDHRDDRDPEALASVTAMCSVLTSMMKIASGARWRSRTPPSTACSFSNSRRRRRRSFLGSPSISLRVHPLQLAHVEDALVDRGEVGEHAAEPPVVDVRHAGRVGGILDHAWACFLVPTNSTIPPPARFSMNSAA